MNKSPISNKPTSVNKILENLELDFNEDFKRAYDLMENSNRFVFITGKAGTGKSTLLKYFVRSTSKKVVLLAPTGVAALNIGGVTIHSFFKFPPRPITDADIRSYPELEIYKIIETIVIDEISMVRADLLDAIDKFMRLNGKYPLKPFGGAQVIFFGDLYQLSPIVANEEEARLFGTYYESPWFFDSKIIQQIDMEIIELSKVYRQKDESFINILDAIRTNNFDNSTLAIINEQYTTHIRDDDVITLTCTNGRAKGINFRKLSQLPPPEYEYLGTIEGEFPIKTLPTDIELRLRKDAQVMFIKNDLHKRWVNGTIGKISNLDDKSVRVETISNGNPYVYEVEQETWEILKYKFNPETRSINTEVVGSFKQYPLKLAWAVTIHKSQGLTFKNLIIDFERGAFAYGQAYVALSRCTSLEGITLKQPIKPSDIKVDLVVNRYFDGIQLARPGRDIELQEEKEIPSKLSSSTNEALSREITETREPNKSTSKIEVPISVSKNPSIEIQETKVVSPAISGNRGKSKSNWASLGISALLVLGAIILILVMDLNQDNKTLMPTNINSLNTSITLAAVKPTLLLTLRPSDTKISEMVRPTITKTPSCILWSVVHLKDVNTKKCIYGQVVGLFPEDQIYYITFSQKIGDFYLISYGKNFPQDIKGKCVQIEGAIEQIGSSPVIVLSKSSNLLFCQPDLKP